MEDQRRISLELFTIVKPTCVELSRISTLPSDILKTELQSLIQSLQTLCNQLDDHEKDYEKKGYSLSTKFADYAFYPITNLLKQPSLPPDATKHILHIMGFLLAHSWLHEPSEALLDQLSPIIVYLCENGIEQNLQKGQESGLEFRREIVYCLNHLVHCFPRDYYSSDGPKRLSILGDITTLLLNILVDNSKPLDQELNKVANDILKCVTWLYSLRVNPEQTSFVFPGIISKVSNFIVTSKNLHANTLISVFDLLQTFIVKIFSDASLQATIVDNTLAGDSISTLKLLYEETEDKRVGKSEIVAMEINTPESSHRSQAWLAATSKQLKIALITIFRHLLIRKSIRDKIVTHKKLQEAIFAFLSQVASQCFRSLFTDIILTITDITLLLIYCILSSEGGDSNDLYSRGVDIFNTHSRSDLNIFHKALFQKADDLVINQLPRVFVSTDDEKVQLTLVAIQFHFCLMDNISSEQERDASKPLKELAIKIIMEGFLNKVRQTDGKMKKAGSDQILDLAEQENSMDYVVLPLHINAKSIAKIKPKNQSEPETSKSSLTQIVKALIPHEVSGEDIEVQCFSSSFTKAVHRSFLAFLHYIGDSMSSVHSILDDLLMDYYASSEPLIERGVFLWVSNALIDSFEKKRKASNISNLVTFYDDEPLEADHEETLYMVLEQAKYVFDDIQKAKTLGETRDVVHKTSEVSFSMAIKSLGTLSSLLPKEDFEIDILMDHLYLLLEAMTYRRDTLVHQLALTVLREIANQHYEGSLQKLIESNADYLIDTLSLNLSVNSSLMPSLPGIMLVVLKISGVDLIKSNHLRDILGEIFIVIDSFHGYSVLVENFFMVFEEVIALIKSIYLHDLLDARKLKSSEPPSPFKPWGITTRDQFLDVLDEKNKQADPFADYDPEKEYFKRKPGVPFGEQDSDDDSDDEDPPADEEKTWPSPIPEDTYKLVLQIFKYGLQLLTHPSMKLRLTIFKTLENAYIMVASNYEALTPVLAEFWPVIMSILSGSKTVSNWESATSEHSQLTEPAIRFATTVFAEDAKHEAFMSRRFLDTWEFLSKHNQMISSRSTSSSATAVVLGSVAPSVRKAYVELFITALNNYERQIPHQTALQIVRVCTKLGIKETEFHLSRDLKSALWVSQNYT